MALKNLARLGSVQRLFLIKYCLSKFEQNSGGGHIAQLIVAASEWDRETLQLCVDLCQINAIDFAIEHWLDLLHASECIRQQAFFSDSSQPQLFKVKSQMVPSLDPLTSYSLYQEWEHWFDKLYELG